MYDLLNCICALDKVSDLIGTTDVYNWYPWYSLKILLNPYAFFGINSGSINYLPKLSQGVSLAFFLI